MVTPFIQANASYSISNVEQRWKMTIQEPHIDLVDDRESRHSAGDNEEKQKNLSVWVSR
jgi:hypothetical protein